MKGHWSLGKMHGVHFAWCLEGEGVYRGAGEVGCAGDGGLEWSASCMDFSSWVSSGN